LVTGSPRWPKSPSALTRQLRRISPQLGTHDIFVEFDRSNERRPILVSTPGIPKKMPSPNEMPSLDNSLMPNGLQLVTAFGP
jgi:hypothetical protein